MKLLLGAVLLSALAISAVNPRKSKHKSTPVLSGEVQTRSGNSETDAPDTNVSISTKTASPKGEAKRAKGNAALNARKGRTSATNKMAEDGSCDGVLDPDLMKDIEAYQKTVEKIFTYVTGDNKGETWRQLGEFVDTHGPRFTGSFDLETAIDDRIVFLKGIKGRPKVTVESMTVPKWIRGETEVKLLRAYSGHRNKTLPALTLGMSVGTSEQGLQAEAIVVRSFDELESFENISGKIVVFNKEYGSFEEGKRYRLEGTAKAAEKGAVAALIRSVTDDAPHAGRLSYNADGPKIPGFSITVEDAKLMSRKQERGDTLELFIRSTARRGEHQNSRNLIAEIPGKWSPHDFVMITCQLDSWDVGQGAVDSGRGAAITWRTIQILKELDLKPRRTIRAVFYSGEELGSLGTLEYFIRHADNSTYAQIILDSATVASSPLGLSSAVNNKEARCIIQQVLLHFKSIKATAFDSRLDKKPEIGSWAGLGVPVASLLSESDEYPQTKVHHTEADAMHLLHSDQLDKATAMWASLAFVLADMQAKIPQDRPVMFAEGHEHDTDGQKNLTGTLTSWANSAKNQLNKLTKWASSNLKNLTEPIGL